MINALILIATVAAGLAGAGLQAATADVLARPDDGVGICGGAASDLTLSTTGDFYLTADSYPSAWGRTSDLRQRAPSRGMIPPELNFPRWLGDSLVGDISGGKIVWFNISTGETTYAEPIFDFEREDYVVSRHDLMSESSSLMLALFSRDSRTYRGARLVDLKTSQVANVDYVGDGLSEDQWKSHGVSFLGSGRNPPRYRIVYHYAYDMMRNGATIEFWNKDSWEALYSFLGRAPFPPYPTVDAQGEERLIFPKVDGGGFWNLAVHDAATQQLHIKINGLKRDLVDFQYGHGATGAGLWARALSADTEKLFDYFPLGAEGREILRAVDSTGRVQVKVSSTRPTGAAIVRLRDVVSGERAGLVRERGAREFVDFERCLEADAPHMFEIVKINTQIKSEGSISVEGFLARPARRSKARIVLVFLHGGPHAVWSPWSGILTSSLINAGYPVLGINYVGSTGYGRDFMNSVYRNVGLAKRSILYSVDEAKRRGLVQPDDAVIAVGESFGGFLGLSMLTDDEPVFDGVISLAGIADVPRYMNDKMAGVLTPTYQDERCDAFRRDRPPLTLDGSVLAEDKLIFGRTDRDRDISYMKKHSISDHVDKIEVPVLLIHGCGDATVPVEQSLALYDRAKIDGDLVELLLLPGQHAYDEQSLGEITAKITEFIDRRWPVETR